MITTIQMTFQRETKSFIVYKTDETDKSGFGTLYVPKSDFPLKGSYPSRIIVDVKNQ